MQATAAETGTVAFWRRLVNARIKKKNRELHSLRCDTSLKLGVRGLYLPMGVFICKLD